MIDARGTAELHTPNIETLEERRFLSSAVSPFAGCASAEPAQASARMMTTMSVEISTPQAGMQAGILRTQVIQPADRLTAEATLLKAVAQMVAIEQQMLAMGMQGGSVIVASQDAQYGESRGMVGRGAFDNDADDQMPLPRGGHHFMNMMPPPSHSPGEYSNDTAVATVGAPANSPPHDPSKSGSSNVVATAPNTPVVAENHVTAQHLGATTPAAVAVTLPPKGV